ncbi:MAG: ATP-binding protein [Gammaproteobacteria bacterium]
MLARGSMASYGLALLSVAVAIAVRISLDPLFGDRLPFSINYIAITLSAAYAGFWPAVAAAIVSIPAGMYFVLEPRGSFAVNQPVLEWGLGLYFIVSLVSILIVCGRQRAVERADQREELLRITLASIGDAVITTDAAGEVTSLNAVAEKLTGWRAHEAQGMPLSTIFDIVNEDTRQPVANPALRALEEGVIVGLANHTILIARDGHECPIDDSAAPIRDKAGRVLGSVLVFRDITERKRDEREIQQVAAALEESNRRKEEFLAILAHELRNPLAPQSNAVELLKKTVTDNAVAHQAIAMLERQQRLMVRLIDDLIDVSRISRNTLTLKREHIDLVETARLACDSCASQFERADVALHPELPATPLYVDADPARMAQVITNLLNNACKFTPPGGEVHLTVAAHDGQAEITVRDTGIGIAPESMSSIFEMFAQVEASAEWTERGLGIGLSLVAQLMALHGGSVSAHSDGLGAGSSFVVRLPLSATQRAAAEQRPVKDRSAAPRRVLIVDDNEDAADSLAMLLSLAGHEVRTAYDGHQALEVAGGFAPELILLDIGLPRMNGHEVCRALRASAAGRDMAIVAVTGWNQLHDRDLSSAAGFDAHLAKPIDYELLTRWMAVQPVGRSERLTAG